MPGTNVTEVPGKLATVEPVADPLRSVTVGMALPVDETTFSSTRVKVYPVGLGPVVNF